MTITDKAKIILVVDDEPGVVRMITKYLNRLGYKVLSAFSAKEGLKLAKRKKPDLIVLDIMMPDMDGFEMLERIKKDRHMKVILDDIKAIVIAINKQSEIVCWSGARTCPRVPLWIT